MTAALRLFLRLQVTRGRVAGLATLAGVGLLVGAAVARVNPFDRAEAAFGFVDGFGLGLAVPVTSLVFAAAALGDLAEDGTLVYVWLRPVRRLSIVLTAFAAAMLVVVPFGVLPVGATAALASGEGRLAVAALGAGALAALAYTALFLGLGLVVRRALAWGLAYLLIWEGFVARSGTAAARLSVLSYARSAFAALAGHDPPRLAASDTVAVLAPVAIATVALATTAWLLRRAEVR